MQRQVGSWRRFRPRSKGAIDDPTVYEHATLYTDARQIVDEMMRRTRSMFRRGHHQLKRTAEASKTLRQRNVNDAPHLLALLLLQTPSAVRAQIEMDRHRGGYSNRQARLFELIDFNDTFVDTVLALDKTERTGFIERLKHEMTVFCASLGQPMFSDEQYEAIVHGLSREIAVFNGAKRLGYVARMTSRVQDAMGVDMIITDPRTKKSIGIDIKTRSAFHWRLVDLQRQNRISEEQRLECELTGYCKIRRPARDGAVDTMLFRISTEHLGEIHDFEFDNMDKFAELLAEALEQYGRYLV